MKKVLLFKLGAVCYTILPALLIVLNLISGKVSAQAQVFCNNEFVIWTEDFGINGSIPSDNPNVINSVYQANGPLSSSGTYRLRNWSDQNVGWHKFPDHTPDDFEGKMAIFNAKAGNFYRKGVTRSLGYPAGFYAVSFWVLNVDIPGTCPNPLLPELSIKAEYRDVNNNWVELGNSPATLLPVPETAVPAWVQVGGVFTLPPTGAFLVKRIRFTLSDNTLGGCGNDFAIDDLKLSTCPSGGPAPVSFLGITAKQKGSGVLINWATASEVNNRSFDVERSIDGGQTWNVIASVAGSGNSSTKKEYAAYDAKPAAGVNYYRIRQVDFDGASKYSLTALYNLKIVGTEVSVLANPFKNNITIDFLSTHSQSVNCTLVEITGKQVMSQQLTIAKGSSRKVIDATDKLNRGVYILHITGENGEILLNEKLVKQ
jgi:hypothetical protein